MGLPKNFPTSPYVVLEPDSRWIPDGKAIDEHGRQKLLPPLVDALRRKVKEFRDNNYWGASATSQSLLRWWFGEPHLLLPQLGGSMSHFQYYFAQREAIETIIYLCDVVKAKDKFDLMRFDSSGAVSAGMFDESWRRYVVKMATGSGKTKVMSLALAWSFFHKTYEEDSDLSRNFLVIAPNIIVLDRLYKDFKGLQIFSGDPVLPYNGYEGQNWQDDFQLTLHRQDEVRVVQPTGNIFLTNIHRVYTSNEVLPSPDDDNTMDYFLGKKPSGATTDSKVDLGMIVRDIDELAVFNDEAHHVHGEKLAWFKSIADIHNRLLQKDQQLSLQIDVTATPKHVNGAIFPQTVADYPLVEAISQDVVKHPVIPDKASQAKLVERQSIRFTEKYADYIDLGVVEWRKVAAEHEKAGKKAILFVMTDDTRNCDEVREYLEGTYTDLEGAVLVIHTKRNGEISESTSGKGKDELERLRALANNIDRADNPYKVIVSVMMLKEGWDVRNVTTIVGLRSYSAKSKILPEQTLGRGLRKMYGSDAIEYLSVVGTQPFMDFVGSIQAEGVTLERSEMGGGVNSLGPLVIEIDQDNPDKNLEKLNIIIPVLTPRIYREYGSLSDLDISKLGNNKVEYREFTENEIRRIEFRDVANDEISHVTELDKAGAADYRSVIGYFARTIMKQQRLVSGYDVLYEKIQAFVANELFNHSVDLGAPNTLRNLAELTATKTLIDAITKGVNDLTAREKEKVQVREHISLTNTRPFVTKQQDHYIPTKSVFNRIIGDSGFELRFARFLDGCADVVSFAKNYMAVGFRLDYVKHNGELSNYYPDFFVKLTDNRVFVVETKGAEELELPHKLKRLRKWCEDVSNVQSDHKFDYVYVNETEFDKYHPRTFSDLLIKN